ncbi:MAG: thioredoxin family protein [Planctomycetes bacterium]|nr:thioredoxin family protein [Planctomycetota bacterium]
MRRIAVLPLLLALTAVLPARAEDSSDDDYAVRVAAGKDQYLKKGNIYRATWEFREAMRLQPASVPAYRAMGACLVKRGDRERGIFYLQEGRRRSPNDAMTQYWLGMGYSNDKRMGLAKYHLEIAKTSLKPSDFPDEAGFQSAMKNVDNLLANATRAEPGKFDGAAAGAPVKLLFEYAANLYGDVTQLTGASVEAGQPLVKELLLVQAWDVDGRFVDPAKLQLTWSCSAGLTANDGGFVAGDKPGKETITVTDTGSKLSATASVVVLGPAVKLALTPETATLSQNQRQPLEARAVDAAGNTVVVPLLRWSLSDGAGLSREKTEQDAESLFEPHRNSFEAPENAAAGSVKIAVNSADGKLKAVITIAIEKRKMDKLQSRAKAVTWENLTLEKAMEKAAQTGKPLLVEITASWCPFCKRFEEGPLSEPKVGEALKDWLAVQVDADQHPELVERYGVDDLPMVALLSPKGSLAGGFGNNLEPTGTDPRTTTDAFLKALGEAKANAPKVDADEAVKVGEAKDAGKMEALARWLWDKKRWADAEKWAREAIKADVKRGEALEAVVVQSAMSFGRHEEAIKEAQGYLAAHPDSTVAAQLTYLCGLCWLRSKQDDKAKAVFAEVQKKWPASVWARKAAQASKK